MALPRVPPLYPARPEEILRPARPWFVVLTLVLGLFGNLLPLTGIALALRPDFLALLLLYWCIKEPRYVGVGVAWMLRNLRLGRYLYAVGGNELAARAAGIRVPGVKFVAYVLCGALAGLAGVVLAARITTGQPNAGVAYELDAIAAVVIGGTRLSGGVGGVGGTLLGVLLMGVIGNGLDLLNVPSYYQQIVKGVIIIGAVWFDRCHQASGKERGV